MLADMWANLTRMRARQFVLQLISFGLIVSSALMIWKSLMIVTGSESPIVVVLRYLSTFLSHAPLTPCPPPSGSMEPAFYRGDLLFLYMPDSPIRVGEIVVFKLDGRDIPIVHRVVKVHERCSILLGFLFLLSAPLSAPVHSLFA